MTNRLARNARVLLGLTLAFSAASPAFAQSTKAPMPKVRIAVESVLDRRTTRDFPRSDLSIAFKLEGEDSAAVRSARGRLTKATDDTGRSLLPGENDSKQGSDRWYEAGEGGAPTPKVELASPSRKAKSLAVEGVMQTYLPSRDPAGTVRIERVVSKKDKPLAPPALKALGIRLKVLSRAGLEEEKKRAKAKKKAEAAMFERLFMRAGGNDLILKVEDPGKKIFSFDLVDSAGAPITSYGTTEGETYWILRMLEPIPGAASLQVRLKTPKSFGEVPFTIANVKLP